jgi:arsenite methyltransferase
MVGRIGIRLFGLLLMSLLAFGCARLKRTAYQGVGRDRWQQPERVIETLDITPGEDIADLGAGGGYFTFRLAEATGEAGIVYAVDVDDKMLRLIARDAQRHGLTNIVTVLARAEDADLPRPVDLVLFVNTYHHLADPVTYFARLRHHLRADARIVIIDFRDRGIYKAFRHSTPRPRILGEMQEAGYCLHEEHEFLDKQWFLVFRLD